MDEKYFPINTFFINFFFILRISVFAAKTFYLSSKNFFTAQKIPLVQFISCSRGTCVIFVDRQAFP